MVGPEDPVGCPRGWNLPGLVLAGTFGPHRPFGPDKTITAAPLPRPLPRTSSLRGERRGREGVYVSARVVAGRHSGWG